MILKITPGAPDSNSFVTVTEADDYIETHFSETDAAKWSELEEDRKAELLVMGCNLFGYFPWRGHKTYIDQVLMFPRHLWTGIPDVIKNAQVELTMNVILRADLVKPGITTGLEATSKISQVSLAGIIAVSFDSEGDTTGTILDQLSRNINMQTLVGLRQYLTQMRGGVVGSPRYTPIAFTG